MDPEELLRRIGALEEQMRQIREESSESWRLTTANEARLKSVQHRVDEAEGREEAAARDIHEIRMMLMKQETRIKATVSLLKVFGSVVTALSILIQIGRAVLL